MSNTINPTNTHESANAGAYTLEFYDLCLPDYFAGHHLPIIQVPVDGTTTYADLKDSLLEVNTCLDHLYYEYPKLDEVKYREAVEKLFSTVSSKGKVKDFVDATLEVVSEENNFEYCQAYFILHLNEQ